MLAGNAFLALWNDIAPHREAEYDQWHTLEHVPERVSVHGFRGARRYVNRHRADHRYFTLYDVDTLAVFTSAEYLDLLEHPTPWSASMRPDFSNFVRAICAVTASNGTGLGAAIACLCVPSAVAEATLLPALEAAGSFPRVNAVHCGRLADTGVTVPFRAPPPNSAPQRAFDRVALIDALDRDAAMSALANAQHMTGLDSLPRDFGADVYDLAFVFPGADAAERLRHRRPGWDSSGA
ncbi:MAG: hypothetical protein ABI831_04695 [Betaproteobacteria bacterium]